MARKQLPTYLIERIEFPANRKGCWRWVGGTKRIENKRHGYTRYEGRQMTARRAVHLYLRGDPGRPLFPACGLDDCVNPDHMTTDPRPAIPAKDKPHGDASTYGNYGCTCRPCKDARAAQERDRVTARRAASAAP